MEGRTGRAWRVSGGAVGIVLAIWGAGAAAGRGAGAPAAPAATPAAAPAAQAGGGVGTAAAGPLHLRSEASFEERRNARGGWDRTVVEPRWEVVRVLLPPRREAVDMLLAERLVSTSHSDAESSESKLAATGWLSGKGRFDQQAWTFTAEADEGAVHGEHDMFMTTRHGCCGGEDVHDWYSLRTGRLAASATGDGTAFAAIPNTPTERILAYHGANGQRPPQTPGPIANLLGVLTLGSHDGPRHRVAVTAAGVDAWTPQLRLQTVGGKEETASLDLWAAAKNPAQSGISGFLVKLTFEDHGTLAIPVERDDFDLAHAVLPPAFHLQRLDG
jgi:hypothetical protein